MLVVTGACGFIGSNLIKRLNTAGHSNIIAVDDFTDGSKVKNVASLNIDSYVDAHQFITSHKPRIIGTLFHQGACADTMEQNGKYMMLNNYTYSTELFEMCKLHAARIIVASSASVYGIGQSFDENSPTLPVNVYAYSKLMMEKSLFKYDNSVSLRYFNVYGNNEEHKGKMASIVHQKTSQYLSDGHITLFHGTSGFGDGQQMRDFVSVDDVVDVNLWFMQNRLTGVYNVGTGTARSFNDVAALIINNCDGSQLSIDELVSIGKIRYVKMPDGLRNRYQSYTCASVEKLKSVGCMNKMMNIENGISRYVTSVNE
jgi:ADP-L-glycero-D-manno-heptose 6-epimerase